mgnify:CR=1 FL=1
MDYHEQHQLLKVAFLWIFALLLETYDVQYGNVRRPETLEYKLGSGKI